MVYIDDIATLNELISSLELEITTVEAGDAASNDPVLYVNVVFNDGTRLYEPLNFAINGSSFGGSTLPAKGDAEMFPLPFTPTVDRTLGEIAEFFIRKPGTDGWFMNSALLFANDHALPLLGNRNANQFLDWDDDVLLPREWSTSSNCVAPATEAKHPLLRSGYRILTRRPAHRYKRTKRWL